MKEIGAARVYSRALFLAAENAKEFPPRKLAQELREVYQLIQSSADLGAELFHALIPFERKKTRLHKAIHGAVGSVSPLVLNFMDLLLKKKRLGQLSLILHHLDQILDESGGILRASLKSAVPLDAGLKKEIEQKLLSIFHKKIILETSVQPELISGIVIKAGDVLMDGSLRTQLKNLQLRLEHGY